MNDVSELVGDLAQSSLIARSIEPKHGEAGGIEPDAGHTHEHACLNCKTALIGSHCHACGQAAHVHRTLGAFFHDLLHGVFHFEGKIWRTLPLLAWRPGKLTREYIDGRRASYVSPIALFLFMVFLTFAVFSFTNDGAPEIGGTPAIASGAADAEREAAAELASLEQKLAAARAANQPTEEIEAEIEGQRAAVEGIRYVKKGVMPDTIVTVDGSTKAEWADRINGLWKYAKKNPDLLIYKLKSSAYKYSWLLIPFSVPFVWLLFPFSRRFHIYDHTVFVTYSLSFMMVLLTAVAALSTVPMGGEGFGGLLLYAPFHLYRQLRGTYAIGRFAAIWRALMLMSFGVFTLVLFALVVLGLSLG